MAAQKIILSNSYCLFCLRLSLSSSLSFCFSFSWQCTFSFRIVMDANWIGGWASPVTIQALWWKKSCLFSTDCWTSSGGSHKRHLTYGVFWWRCNKTCAHSIALLCRPSLIKKKYKFRNLAVSALRETGVRKKGIKIYWLSYSEQNKFQRWHVIFGTQNKEHLRVVWPCIFLMK